MEFVDRVVLLHRTLTEESIPHAFGGALALAYHATPRGTVEIDLNVFLPPDRAAPVIDHLATVSLDPPPGGLDGTIPTAGLRCPWGDTHVDLFFSYDAEYFASVQQRTELHLFEDSGRRLHELPFLSAEDLCVFKMTFNRQKDWADIEAMLDEAPLNAEYVQTWLLHLRGDHEWPQIRRFLNLIATVAASRNPPSPA